MNKEDQFDKWCDQWEKALGTDEFKASSKPAEASTGFNGTEPDFFGNYRPQEKSSVNLKDSDSEYWKQVYKMSAHPGMAPDITDDEDMITEELNDEEKETFPYTKPDKKSSVEITDDLGKLPQRVQANTRGKDQRLKVTPNWSCGDELVELHNLKIKLQKLEDKLSSDPMTNEKKSKTIIEKIKALKEKIDDVSDSLSPDFETDYLS
jgi:hypothetical protein